jgi:hypothetical protein
MSRNYLHKPTVQRHSLFCLFLVRILDLIVQTPSPEVRTSLLSMAQPGNNNGANPTDQRLQTLETWRVNTIRPWKDTVNTRLHTLESGTRDLDQNKLNVGDYIREHNQRDGRIDILENRFDNSWNSTIPQMRGRVDEIEGRLGKVEKQTKESGQAVNELTKMMSKNQKYLMKEIGRLPDKLGQPYGMGGRRVSGGDQTAFQDGFINMIIQQQIQQQQQQQQLFPVIPWGGCTPLPPAPAPTCRYCIHRTPCIHVGLRYKSSSKKKW